MPTPDQDQLRRPPLRRPLGRTGLEVSPVGYGAFKIGRNEGIKYAEDYALPEDDAVEKLLHGVLDLGINLIDTAPAYGTSEERIGRVLGERRDDIVLSTKVGETFADGVSMFDFSRDGMLASVERSLERLRTESLDLVLIHSDGDDEKILNETEAVETVLELKTSRLARAVGFSGKTIGGALAALEWADVLMVEYHLDDQSHLPIIERAAERNIGILVKKPLASGRLSPAVAIPFILRTPGVSSAVIGGLNLEHLRDDLLIAGMAEGECSRAAEQ